MLNIIIIMLELFFNSQKYEIASQQEFDTGHVTDKCGDGRSWALRKKQTARQIRCLLKCRLRYSMIVLSCLLWTLQDWGWKSEPERSVAYNGGAQINLFTVSGHSDQLDLYNFWKRITKKNTDLQIVRTLGGGVNTEMDPQINEHIKR